MLRSLPRLIVSAVLSISCSRDEAPPPLESPDRLVPLYLEPRTGHILFRRGRSLISRAALWAVSAREFSHVDSIVRRDDEVLAIHAEPGGPLRGWLRARGADRLVPCAGPLAIASRRLRLFGQTRDVVLPCDIAASQSFRFLTGSSHRIAVRNTYITR